MPARRTGWPLLRCDLCQFHTKNRYMFQRHKKRCRQGVLQAQAEEPKKTEIDPGGGKIAGTMDNINMIDLQCIKTEPLDADYELGTTGDETSEYDDGLEDSMLYDHSMDQLDSSVDGTESPSTSGKRPTRHYTCDMCGFKSTECLLFLYHMIDEHNKPINVFPCTMCDYASAYKAKVIRHIKIIHKLDLTSESIHASRINKTPQALAAASSTPRSRVKIPLSMVDDANRKMLPLPKLKLASLLPRPGGSSKSKATPIALPKLMPSLSPKVSPVPSIINNNNSTTTVKQQDKGSAADYIQEITDAHGQVMYKCKACNYTGSVLPSAYKHANMCHINARKFKCRFCDYKSSSKVEYYIHQSKHSDQVVHRCPECLYTSYEKSNLDVHMKHHDSGHRFKCPLCNYASEKPAALTRHLGHHHPNDPNILDSIQQSIGVSADNDDSNSQASSFVDSLNADVSNNDKIEETSLASSGALDESYICRSAMGLFCMRCGYNARDDDDLQLHLSMHRKYYWFQCQLCMLEYKRNPDLGRHMRIKHSMGIKEFVDQQIKALQPVEVEEEHHSNDSDDGTELFEPEDEAFAECGDEPLDLSVKETANPSSISRSQLLGMKVMNLKCKYCSYIGKWPSDLRRHMMVHTVEKRYKCHHCLRKYKYIGDLNMHIRRDHNVEPDKDKIERISTVTHKKASPRMYRCPSCPFSSQWKAVVKAHSRKHVDEDKPYRCMLCSYQTHWSSDCRRHIFKYHQDVLGDKPPDTYMEVHKGKRQSNTSVLNPESKPYFVKQLNYPKVKISLKSSQQRSPVKRPSLVSSPLARKFAVPNSDPNDHAIQCKYCNFVANGMSRMKTHIESHVNLKLWKCPKCWRRSNWKWDISKHIRKDHRDCYEDVIKLTEGEASATIQRYLSTRPVVHHGNHIGLTMTDAQAGLERKSIPYRCSLCSYNSAYKWVVVRHLKNEHDGENGHILVDENADDDEEDNTPPDLSDKQLTFKCSDCEYASPNRTDVSRHIRVRHSGQNATLIAVSGSGSETQGKKLPFQCMVCSFSSMHRWVICRHMRQGHPDQPVEVKCNYPTETLNSSTASAGSPVKNINTYPTAQALLNTSTASTGSPSKNVIDSPVKPKLEPIGKNLILAFQCGLCNYGSMHKWVVARHMRQEHPGKPIDVRINYMPESSDHERSSGKKSSGQTDGNMERPYMCGECGRCFPRKGDATKHCSFKHYGKEIQIWYIENNTSPMPSATMSNEVEPSPTVTEPVEKVSEDGGTQGPPGWSNPKTHGYIRPFMCAACGKRSNWKWEIRKHIRTFPSCFGAELRVLSMEEATATLNEAIVSASRNAVSNSINAPLKGAIIKKERKYKCSICPYISNWKGDAIKHVRSKHLEAGVVLTLESETYNQSSNFAIASSTSVTPPKPRGPYKKQQYPFFKPPVSQALKYIWICQICGYRHHERQVLTNHLTKIHSLKPYGCKLCEVSSMHRSVIHRHIRMVHHSKDFELCQFGMKYCRDELDDDAPSPPKKKAFAAPRQYVTVETTPVVNASQNVTEKKKWQGTRYYCDQCPYSVTKLFLLTFHQAYHKPQPGNKFKCKLCPYFVATAGPLKKHMRVHRTKPINGITHKNEQPDMTTVDSVMAVSSPSRRYQCEKCPYMTNIRNDYFYHKQFHRPKLAGSAPYKCDLCDYWVTHRRLLKQHQRIHEMFAAGTLEFSVNADSDRIANVSDGANLHVTVSPAKSDLSSNVSWLYNPVNAAMYKQQLITGKVIPALSESMTMSPMKGNLLAPAAGYVLRNGRYRKLHKCTKCPYTNMQMKNLRLHERMHGWRTSNKPLYKCLHCDYCVGSRGLLGHHMKVHQVQSSFDPMDNTMATMEKQEGGVVPIVDTDSDSASTQNGHIIEISNEARLEAFMEMISFKKYACEKCPYGTAKRNHYERHLELHGSKQRCTCDYCDYSVPSHNLLSQHTKLHLSPNPNLLASQSFGNLQALPAITADVAVKASFSAAVSVTDPKKPFNLTHDHMDMYENGQNFEDGPKKLYRCDRCPYANMRRDYLLTHLKFHMLISDMTCPYCDYSVSKQHLMTQHIRVHFSPLPEFSEWLQQTGLKQRQRLSASDKVDQDADTVNGMDTDEVIEPVIKTRKRNNVKQSADSINHTEQNGSQACDLQNGASQANSESTEMDKADSEEMDMYICQYCDRKFSESELLLKHEMQHLIGNRFLTDDLINSELKRPAVNPPLPPKDMCIDDGAVPEANHEEPITDYSNPESSDVDQAVPTSLHADSVEAMDTEMIQCTSDDNDVMSRSDADNSLHENGVEHIYKHENNTKGSKIDLASAKEEKSVNHFDDDDDDDASHALSETSNHL